MTTAGDLTTTGRLLGHAEDVFARIVVIKATSINWIISVLFFMVSSLRFKIVVLDPSTPPGHRPGSLGMTK